MIVPWSVVVLQAAALLQFAAPGNGDDSFWDMIDGSGSKTSSSSTGGVGRGRSTVKETSRRWGNPPATKSPVQRQLEIPIKETSGDIYVKLKVGSPGQELTALLDTGSYHLWLIAEGTTKEGCTAFKSSHSSTHTTENEQCRSTFGSGTLEGFWGYDNIQIGEGSNTIQVDKLALAEATKIDKDMFKQYDAVIGLGIISEEPIQGDPEPFLKRLGQVYSKVPPFGVYFNKFNIDKSKLIVGGPPENPYVAGSFNTHDVVKENGNYIGWIVNIDRVDIKNGDSIATPDGQEATLDTGCSLIMAPKEIVDKINAAIFKNKPDFIMFKDYYKIACSELTNEQTIQMYQSLPDVSIFLDGKEYVFKSNDYLLQNARFCMSVFQPFQEILLGKPFLIKYYTRFDYEEKKVQIAEAKQDQSADYIVTLMQQMSAGRREEDFTTI